MQLHIRVTPSASRNEINGFIDDVLQVKVAAVLEKGKANKELINYLSRIFGVSKTSLRLVKGQASRHKVIEIDDLSREEIIRRISG